MYTLTPHRDITGTASITGFDYKDILNAQADKGWPVSAMTVENYGVCLEALQIADSKGVGANVFFRFSSSDSWNVPGNNYTETPSIAAQKHFDKIIAALPKEWDYRTNLVVWNEIDKNKLPYCAQTAILLGEKLKTVGIKAYFFGMNSGEPEKSQWEDPQVISFLQWLVNNNDMYGLALHEYYAGQPVKDAIPWRIGRWQFLREVCIANNIDFNRMNLAITEFGFGYNSSSFPSTTEAIELVKIAMDVYKEASNIKCVAMWVISANAQWGGDSISSKVMNIFKETVKLIPQATVEESQWASPVHSDRKLKQYPPGKWIDVNPYANKYTMPSGSQAYHTGSDLNLNDPTWDSDRFAPVFSIGPGKVIAAGSFPVWGNIVVVEHTFNGKFYWSRYAHLDKINVGVGTSVTKYAQLGNVGKDLVGGPYHLHFDIMRNQVSPSDWPGLDLDRVKRDYIDPVEFFNLVWNTIVLPPSTGIESGLFLLMPQAFDAKRITKVLDYAQFGILNSTIGRDKPTEKSILGVWGWSHRDLIDLTIKYSGNNQTRLVILDGDKIGTGLDRAWILANFPSIAPLCIWLKTEEPVVSPPPPPPPPPSTGTAYSGIHLNASGGDLKTGELDLLKTGKFTGVKILSSTSPNSIKQITNIQNWIVRPWVSMEGRFINPDQYFLDTITDVRNAVNAIGSGKNIIIEPHNEPNITIEGLGTSYKSAAEYIGWLDKLLSLYKQVYPNLRYCFPGLSPGGNVTNFKLDDITFYNACRALVTKFDYLGVHVYWSNPGYPLVGSPIDRRSGLTYLDWYRNNSNRPILVTEYSNNKPDTAKLKGEEYSKFYKYCKDANNVLGCFSFVSTAHPDTFKDEKWLELGIGPYYVAST